MRDILHGADILIYLNTNGHPKQIYENIVNSEKKTKKFKKMAPFIENETAINNYINCPFTNDELSNAISAQKITNPLGAMRFRRESLNLVLSVLAHS